jgi:hypothetical protein
MAVFHERKSGEAFNRNAGGSARPKANAGAGSAIMRPMLQLGEMPRFCAVLSDVRM